MMTEGFSVLVVDDNEMNRDTLARRLRQQSCVTTLAASGREALAMVKSQDFDLILLDIMMPEIDGYQVLQTLKADQELREIPIIMISAVEEIDSVMKCMEMGAEDYLTKPFDPVLLKAAVTRCLKKSSSLPPLPLFNEQRTVLQLSTGEKQANDPQAKVADLTIEEVISRIMRSNKISRKGYMHLSKAIYNAIFSSHQLTEQECNQINSILYLIRSGQIKIID